MLDYNRMIATWNEFLQEFPDAIDLEEFDLLAETAYIKKNGSKWCVYGDGGRGFGCYASRKKAEERLAQIEMFRHMKSGQEEAARLRTCVCEDCGTVFMTSKYCDLAACPTCGKYDAFDPDEDIASKKEAAKFQCECGQCGRLFWSGRRCDQATCPSCGEQDDIEEITGEV